MLRGGSKYTINDIVDGKRTLANGSIAGYVNDAKGQRVWRIISSKNVDMSKLRKKKNGQTRARKISPLAAKRAFNKHYLNRKGSKLGNRQARSYDLNHTSKRVVGDARYLRSPHLYDYRGVDAGSKVRAPRTKNQKLNDDKPWMVTMRGGLIGGKGRPSGSKNISKHCGVDLKRKSLSPRCRKKDAGKGGENCYLNKKTNWCRKSTRGKRVLPKNPKSVARGKELQRLGHGKNLRPRRKKAE